MNTYLKRAVNWYCTWRQRKSLMGDLKMKHILDKLNIYANSAPANRLTKRHGWVLIGTKLSKASCIALGI